MISAYSEYTWSTCNMKKVYKRSKHIDNDSAPGQYLFYFNITSKLANTMPKEAKMDTTHHYPAIYLIELDEHK